MGRQRTTAKHLPQHMMQRHGRYYFVTRENGRQRWIPLGGDYGIALHEWARLTGKPTLPITTVADALSAYIADRDGNLSPRTITGYKAQSVALGKVFGAMRLEDVERAHVYRYMTMRGNVAGNRERDLLRAAFNHAANLGYRGGNPCLDMQFRNKETPRKRYVTDEELAALVLAAKPRFANLLLFLHLTAMRITDAITLPITAADADGIRWAESKTKEPRLVAWSDALREVWRSATGIRIGAQPAFLGQRGPYTLDGVESTWARVRKRAGIHDVRLHDLRRKAASDLPLAHAQALLGHASPETTKRHYRAKPQPVQPAG